MLSGAICCRADVLFCRDVYAALLLMPLFTIDIRHCHALILLLRCFRRF